MGRVCLSKKKSSKPIFVVGDHHCVNKNYHSRCQIIIGSGQKKNTGRKSLDIFLLQVNYFFLVEKKRSDEKNP